MNYKQILKKIEYIKQINDCKIPQVIDFNEFSIYIKAWNEYDNNFEMLNNFEELVSYNSDFSKFLNKLNKVIYDIWWKWSKIFNDFTYFKERFFSEYKKSIDNLKKINKKNNIENKKN